MNIVHNSMNIPLIFLLMPYVNIGLIMNQAISQTEASRIFKFMALFSVFFSTTSTVMIIWSIKKVQTITYITDVRTLTAEINYLLWFSGTWSTWAKSFHYITYQFRCYANQFHQLCKKNTITRKLMNSSWLWWLGYIHLPSSSGIARFSWHFLSNLLGHFLSKWVRKFWRVWCISIQVSATTRYFFLVQWTPNCWG